MEKEPLLPCVIPKKKPKPVQLFPGGTPPAISSPSLCPLPEHGEIIVPPGPSSLVPPSPMTPSELKDRLIFGPSSSSPSDFYNAIDTLTLTIESARSDEHTPTPNTAKSSLSQWLNTEPSSNTNTRAKPNLHRSKTAPAMAVINDVDRRNPLQKPKSGSVSVVRQAFFLLLIYLSLGVVIYSLNRNNFAGNETHPVVDALYFCIVTMCTIGYGDITPNTTTTKLFSIMFVLVGFGFIDILLSGMVTYVLDVQENLLLTTIQGRGKQNVAKSYIFDVKKGRMRIRMKVGLALGVVVLCIGIGTGVMHFVEKLGWLDSIYLSVMSVTTVGYGDRAFHSLPGRLFASVWLLVSTLAVARAFLYLAEARIDKRHRTMAKWVLSQDMTVSEFLAADIDNNGSVSKSEYVIYKLKEMGKVVEKDILQICTQFDHLDTGKCGKITLADLMENHR